ncbi:hypothetical protein SDC9_56875 [bioreactor metagenome]|uniref:EamA domain-containing protein n=1 Tax=bioreactor metagenome TaxID=1076179 RepID=A0A644X8E8_9ZZZZ
MNQFAGRLYLICAFSLAGTSVISARFVTGKLGTFTITAASLFFALLFLMPLCGKQMIQYLKKMPFRNFLFLSFQALCGIFLFRVFLLTGLHYTSAGEAGILTGATPAITAVLALVVLREPVTGKKLAGIFATVAGILTLQGVLTPGNALAMKHIRGNLLVLCAAASESAFNTLSRVFTVKAAAEQEPLSPVVQTTIVSVTALILCIIPAAFEHPLEKLSGLSLMGWIALLWYGIFVTALAFVFWYSGIKRCGVFTAAAFSGMMPFASVLLSAAVLGESIGFRQWIGGFFVIAGMILIGINPAADKAISVSKYAKAVERNGKE